MTASNQSKFSISVVSRVNGERKSATGLRNLSEVREKASSLSGGLIGECNVFVYTKQANQTHEGSLCNGKLSLESVQK